MDKKKVIIAGGIAAAAVVVGIGATCYTKHEQKEDAKPESVTLSDEEAKELLDGVFGDMETAEVSVNSITRWKPGDTLDDGTASMEDTQDAAGTENVEGTADTDETENTEGTTDTTDTAVNEENIADADSNDNAASADDANLSGESETSSTSGGSEGEQTTVYNEGTLSSTTQFSGKNVHSVWVKQNKSGVTDDSSTDATITDNVTGETYMSETDGTVTKYVKTGDSVWAKTENVENAVSGTEYMNAFTFDNLENVKVENKDKVYVVNAEIPYEDIAQIGALVSGNDVSVSDDDFSGKITDVTMFLSEGKQVTTIQLSTNNLDGADVNGDNMIADSSIINITFTTEDVIDDEDSSSTTETEENTDENAENDSSTSETEVKAGSKEAIKGKLLSDDVRQSIESEIQADAEAKAAAEAQAQAEAEAAAQAEAEAKAKEEAEAEKKKQSSSDNGSTSSSSTSSNSNSSSSKKSSSSNSSNSSSSSSASSSSNSSASDESTSDYVPADGEYIAPDVTMTVIEGDPFSDGEDHVPETPGMYDGN